MNQHDQSPCPDVVDQPRKTDEGDGGHVVNYLFFEILKKKKKKEDRNGWCKNQNPPDLVTYWSSCKDRSPIDILSYLSGRCNFYKSLTSCTQRIVELWRYKKKLNTHSKKLERKERNSIESYKTNLQIGGWLQLWCFPDKPQKSYISV